MTRARPNPSWQHSPVVHVTPLLPSESVPCAGMMRVYLSDCVGCRSVPVTLGKWQMHVPVRSFSFRLLFCPKVARRMSASLVSNEKIQGHANEEIDRLCIMFQVAPSGAFIYTTEPMRHIVERDMGEMVVGPLAPNVWQVRVVLPHPCFIIWRCRVSPGRTRRACREHRVSIPSTRPFPASPGRF